MRTLVVVVALAIASPVAAQQTPVTPPGTPAPAVPGAPASPAPQTPGQTPSSPTAPAATPAPVAARTFTAPTGIIFNTVNTARVADFEKLLAYIQAALQKSTDPTVQAQARGWRFLKASEPGPGNTALYVFLFDPTVAGADYSLGRLLADVFTDPAELQAIWRLYTGSVVGGGSLLNLSPVKIPPLPTSPIRPGSPSTPDATTPPAPSAPPVAAPTSDPNQPLLP